MSIIKSKKGAVAPAVLTAALSLLCAPLVAQADIAVGIPHVEFQFGGQAFSVKRNASGESALPNFYANTARICPEYCIEPGIAAPDVVTLTELDVFAFMQENVTNGSGLLVDVRLPADFAAGSIPGAISLPAATLVANNPYREDLLLALGAKGELGQMDFSNAFDLLVFDDGPWSPTAREAVQLLLGSGYPAQKIRYYRGGLQMWHIFGLTVSR